MTAAYLDRAERRAPKNRSVDFFVCIGAQKAGTTTLARFLESHPEIYIPKLKEMHFFDTCAAGASDWKVRVIDDIRRRYRRLERLTKMEAISQAAFDDIICEIASIVERAHVGNDGEKYVEMLRGPGPKKLSGEITPAYALLKESEFEYMRMLLNDPFIIFVLRNPVDRFLSQVSFRGSQLSRVVEDIKNPLQFLERRGFVECSTYEKTIERLEWIFPREHIHLCFFEDLIGPRAKLSHEKLCDFLSVSKGHVDTVTASNEILQKSTDPEIRSRLVNFFEPTFSFAACRFQHLPECWRRDLELLS